MQNSKEKYILELGPDAVRFDPVSNLTNVFFDETNRQIFAVRSGGTTGVVVKGPNDDTIYSFRMVDKGEVLSIKFSPDKKILSVQRCYKSIEFINFDGEPENLEYSQSCKGKNMKILGFAWTNINEIIFVMDKAIELFQVIPEKHTLKSLKSYNVMVNWYVYHQQSSLLLLSSGNLCNVMYPYLFSVSLLKLQKFEIDIPSTSKAQSAPLLERDVSIATVYGKTCVFVLRHHIQSSGQTGAEIAIYTLESSYFTKTDVLILEKSGRYAINVIDNVIIVHHQASKESMLFDIRIKPYESDKKLSLHIPVLRCPIKPFLIKVPTLPSHSPTMEQEIGCELYSPNWVVFLPNIIIDPKLGYLWNVILNTEPTAGAISDKCLLVDFLLLRQNTKTLILSILQAAIMPETQLSLSVLAKIFDRLNIVCKFNKELQRKGCSKTSSQNLSSAVSNKPSVVIEETDMFTHVFSIFEGEYSNQKFAVSVLIEYIRSLMQHKLEVEHFLSKLLINILVQNKQFYQLHQFLQYQILKDSKELACLMLSLQGHYAPAYQLGFDMLRRLTDSNEEIIDVLLSEKKIIQALSFIRSYGDVNSLSAQKYLSAAKQTGDPNVFYAVYKFFEQRNVKLRGSPDFESLEHCDMYVKYFNNLFGNLNYDGE